MNDTTHHARQDHTDKCPRCGAPLRSWDELSAEGQEVARRLPASADFPLAERARRHRFCVRCWHEEAGDAPRTI